MRVQELKLYPNQAQAAELQRFLDTARWAHNWALEQRISHYKLTGKTLGYNKQTSALTQERKTREDWATVPCHFQRDGLRRVDLAFQAFFRRLKTGEKPGFPRFKGDDRYDSMTYGARGDYLRGEALYVPCLGAIRCRSSNRILEGTQTRLTIIRRATGWYAQVLFSAETAAPEKVTEGKAIGIDLGLKTFAVLSDGTEIKNQRWFKQAARKLTRLHRQLSRKKKGSKNRKKAKLLLTRAYERLVNLRKNFCHHLSKWLVQKYDLIGFEDFNISSLSRKGLAKSILDACWGLLRQYTAYKAAYAGKWCLQVESKGTTQECSDCHEIVPKTLADRIHRCPHCGLVLCRDLNAALNVLQRALRAVGPEFTPVERPIRGLDEAGSLTATSA